MTGLAGEALTASAIETIARIGGLVAGRAGGHHPTLLRAPHDFADSSRCLEKAPRVCIGAERGIRTLTRLPSTVFEFVERLFVAVRHRPPKYENPAPGRPSVRRCSPKFALTAVKLLSCRVCWHTMKRTTVKLPDELDARLRHEAERRGMTVSEVTREAIETHLVGPGGKRRLGAAGRSGKSDISHRIEEILRSELAGH